MGNKVYPLCVGDMKTDLAGVYYRGSKKEFTDAKFGFFAIKCDDGEVIVVDTGNPSNEDIDAKKLPYPKLENGKSAIQCLSEINIDPKDVKTLILTHLHWDHSWNMDLFPNAKIYVQKDELQHAIAPYPHETFPFEYLPGLESYAWYHYRGQMVVVEGDWEYKPGIEVIFTPGHTAGGQSVIVDTDEGKIGILGDWIFNLMCLRADRPAQLHYSLELCYKYYPRLEKLIKEGVELLPTHEPKVYEKEVYG